MSAFALASARGIDRPTGVVVTQSPARDPRVGVYTAKAAPFMQHFRCATDPRGAAMRALGG